MPEYLAPGVFIEEIERGPRPIEGVATSTAAFLGETERGPTRPRLVTSFNEYRRYFGTRLRRSTNTCPMRCRAFSTMAAAAPMSAGSSGRGRNPPAAPSAASGSTRSARELGQPRLRQDHRQHDQERPQQQPGRLSPAGRLLANASTQQAYPDPFDPPQAGSLPRPTLIEDFDNLVWTITPRPDYFVKRLGGQFGARPRSAAPGQPNAQPAAISPRWRAARPAPRQVNDFKVGRRQQPAHRPRRARTRRISARWRW